MAGRTARFAHVWGVGAWFSASPRVQRLVAAQVGVVLATGIGAVAAHQPASLRQPLTVAAAVGPVEAMALTPATPNVRPARLEVSRSDAAARPKAKTAAKPKAPKVKDWAYWSGRIRGCESHGHPGAAPDYKAENPDSTASGAYQILDTTWAGRFGVAHASDATPEQQEQAAAELYRRRGTADWAASEGCWRSS